MKHFRFQVMLRVFALSISVCVLFYLIFKTGHYVSAIILGLLTFYWIYSLARYVERTNRELTRFLQAIRYADFSQSFRDKNLGSSFKDLNQSFMEVIKNFQMHRADKEEHYRYLQTVIQHVGVGLIAFLPDGTVDLINNTAKRLLCVASLRNIKHLKSLSEELVETLFQLKSGEKTLIKVGNIEEVQQLAIYATEFRLRDKQYTLVSIQNIHRELEEKEMEAWQNMIRVLTHEIMNSITPISSLASTARDLAAAPSSSSTMDTETLEDIHSSLKTIHKRSEGLLHFVQAYRNLTLIPKPKFRLVRVTELFERVKQLMEVRISAEHIGLHTVVDPEGLEITADPELIEQLLINLLLNSIDALQGVENPHIDLLSQMDARGRVLVKIIDNGSGIVKEAIEKIFIPFFSTKKKGSGIGLSLAKQIMRLHDGTIRAQSTPGAETTFTLRF